MLPPEAPVSDKFLSLKLPMVTPNSAGNWISVGPEGGLINALIMHPTDHNVVYAQTYANPAQIYKSIDGGTTWTLISFIPSYIYAITIDPANPTTIYAASSGYIYKSVDSGLTWNKYRIATDYPYISDIFVCPTNSNIIYLGGYYYNTRYIMVMYKSTNGGLNWTRYEVSPSSYQQGYTYCFAVNPTDNNVLYIGGDRYDGSSYAAALFKSSDGGASWTNIFANGIAGSYVNSLAIDPISPNKIFAGTSNGVYRSSNSGSSWLKNSGSVYSYELAIDPKNTNIIYSGYYQSVYKSTNGGINWTYSSSGLLSTCYTLLVDHTVTSNIYFGSLVGIFKSSNGGINWSAANSGLIAASIIAMGMASSDPRTIYIEFDNNAVFKTTNSGENWTRLTEFLACGNIGAIAVHPTSPGIAYALEGSG